MIHAAISEKTLRMLAAGLHRDGPQRQIALSEWDEAHREISAAVAKLDRKRQRKAPTRAAKAAKKQSKKERTAEVRGAVLRRAQDRCRASLGIDDTVCENCGAFGGLLEMDHMRGRARSESVATCWMLCGGPDGCHDRKTRNLPSAGFWLEAFVRHCDRYAHWGPEYGDAAREASKRLAFVTTRAGLPAAPGVSRVEEMQEGSK
jgi:hypothetical protein